MFQSEYMNNKGDRAYIEKQTIIFDIFNDLIIKRWEEFKGLQIHQQPKDKNTYHCFGELFSS